MNQFSNPNSARSRSFAALVAGVAVIGLSAPSDASIQLAVSPDDVTYTTLTLTPGLPGQYSYTNTALAIGTANFNVNFAVTTNSPGTPTLAQLINLETTIRQSGAGGANRDVYIRVTDDTFTQPVGANLILNSKLELIAGAQGGPGDRFLTSTFMGDSTQTLGPHAAGTLATAAFTSNAAPFTLQNVTYVFLTPSESITTKSTTWIASPGTPPPPPGLPEMPSGVVWACLAAVSGLVAKWRGLIG